MADEQVVTTTTDTAEQPADQTDVPVQTTEEGNEAQVQQAQADKEKVRIKNALSNLQKERDELRAKVSQYEQSISSQELEPDEDGTVAFKGANVPAELAKELQDLRATVGQIAASTGQKDISQIDAQIAEAEQSFQQAFVSDVQSARKSAFPNIPDEKASFIDKVMIMSANEKVGEQRAAGTELFDIDFAQTIQSVLNDFKSTFGSLVEQQMNDNENYRQTSAPKSNGIGGITQPKPVSQMNRQERNAYLAEVQRIAVERSGA